MRLPLTALHPLSFLLLGLLYPLGFAPISFWPATALSVILFFYGLTKTTKVGRSSFLYAFSAFALGISWVYVSIHVYGNTSALLAGFLTFLFITVYAFLFAASFWVAAKLFRRISWLWIPLGLPLAWLGTETVRAHFMGGFPWLLVGGSQLSGPLAPLLPLGSVWLVSWVYVLCAGLIVTWIHLKAKRSLVFGAILASFIVGTWCLPPWVTPQGETPPISLIQANISQHIKWEPGFLEEIVQTYVQLSERLDSQVIVWAEAAIPDAIQYTNFMIAPYLRAHPNTALILGTVWEPKEGAGYYNALLGRGEASGLYLKQQLVPFGDYVPFESMLRGLIAFFNLPQSAHRAGARPLAPLTTPIGSFSGLICYEIAFSELSRNSYFADSLAIINVSNDTWFGTSWGPHQHLELARLRAKELGRPVLRTTNSGISAFIDADGTVLARTALETQTVLTRSCPYYKGKTPWMRWGFLVFWLFFGVTSLTWAWGFSHGRMRSLYPS